jgi:hypothetical protein
MSIYVDHVTHQQVFNLPLYETYLVIDCRPSDVYDACRIQSAFNYPPVASDNMEEKVNNMNKFIEFMDTHYLNERWTPIVLYGDESNQLVTEHVTQFSNLLSDFIETKRGIVRANNVNTAYEGLIEHISNRTEKIWILNGGFDEFQKHYPCLCLPVDKTVDDISGASSMIPLPYHIDTNGEGVFISSRAVRWTSDLLNSFKVKALVMDMPTSIMMSPELTHTECEIESFVCSLPDHGEGEWSTDNLELLFDKVSDFINECVLSHKRVVVHLHGRSHSAALCIAWYMKYKNISYNEAKQLLQSVTPANGSSLTSVLDSNLLFEKQLVEWRGGRKRMIEDVDNVDNR